MLRRHPASITALPPGSVPPYPTLPIPPTLPSRSLPTAPEGKYPLTHSRRTIGGNTPDEKDSTMTLQCDTIITETPDPIPASNDLPTGDGIRPAADLPEEQDDRPQICVTLKQLPEAVAAAEIALAAYNDPPVLFNHGGNLVKLVLTDGSAPQLLPMKAADVQCAVGVRRPLVRADGQRHAGNLSAQPGRACGDAPSLSVPAAPAAGRPRSELRPRLAVAP